MFVAALSIYQEPAQSSQRDGRANGAKSGSSERLGGVPLAHRAPVTSPGVNVRILK